MPKWSASGASAKSLAEEIEYCRSQVKLVALGVRECGTCYNGFIDIDFLANGIAYHGVRRCGCLKEYEAAWEEMLESAKEYERLTGREYRDLVTSEMKALHHHEDSWAKKWGTRFVGSIEDRKDRIQWRIREQAENMRAKREETE